MSLSRKYGRTYHYPFSPGTSSDDRINHDYWSHISSIEKMIGRLEIPSPVEAHEVVWR